MTRKVETMSTKVKMITRILPKPTLQAILKDIRNNVGNLTVAKDTNGYTVTTRKGLVVLKAMNGNNDYLTRWHPKLLAAFNG